MTLARPSGLLSEVKRVQADPGGHCRNLIRFVLPICHAAYLRV